jgi:hypothetical protein
MWLEFGSQHQVLPAAAAAAAQKNGDNDDDVNNNNNNNNVKAKFISVIIGVSGTISKSFKQYIPVLTISVN